MSEAHDILTTLRAALPELRQRCRCIRSRCSARSRVVTLVRRSDLDVLVEFERPVTLSAFLALEDTLADMTRRRVDLVSTCALKPHIRQRVRAEAVAV